MQYDKAVDIPKALLAAEKRCMDKFGVKLKGRLFFRVRTHQEGFPTLFTAKRNIIALKEEGLSDKCIIPSVQYGKNK